MNCDRPWNGKLSATLKIRGGGDVDRFGKSAGKGALVQWERSGTLGVVQDQTLIVFEPRSQDGVPRIVNGDVSPTLNTARGGQRQPCVMYETIQSSKA